MLGYGANFELTVPPHGTYLMGIPWTIFVHLLSMFDNLHAFTTHPRLPGSFSLCWCHR